MVQVASQRRKHEKKTQIDTDHKRITWRFKYVLNAHWTSICILSNAEVKLFRNIYRFFETKKNIIYHNMLTIEWENLWKWTSDSILYKLFSHRSIHINYSMIRCTLAPKSRQMKNATISIHAQVNALIVIIIIIIIVYIQCFIHWNQK